MSKKEKANAMIGFFNDLTEIGRLWGKAEAYEYMQDLLKKSRLKNSNPKLLLNTLCLCLDSACDALEKCQKYVEDVSPTVTKQISIMIDTISTLSDNVKIAMNEKNYEEAFKHVGKAKRQMKSFTKENERLFQVFMEVSRKRIEDMFI